MENVVLLLSVISVILSFIILFLSLRRRGNSSENLRKDLATNISKIEELYRDENDRLKRDVDEIASRVENNNRIVKDSLNILNEKIVEKLNTESNGRLKDTILMQSQINDNFDKIRSENKSSFKETTAELEKLSTTINDRLKEINKNNEEKLKEIQGVVDQKLQEALDKNIKKAFEEVQVTLGELHKSVGSLDSLKGNVEKMNNLFSNTKSRGFWGEKQAENILEDILVENEQWIRNYHPEGRKDVVEFAIKMPGKTGNVFLPVDSKFSITSFENYKNAVQNGNEGEAESALKTLKTEVKKEAKSIHDKYISPPETTDFGIMFIPSESLYLEIIKIDGILDEIQNDYRVILTGPGNFAAMLNALSLGFKTLQIEKYTSRIWSLFENLKKLFSDLSKKIDDSKKDVDKAQASLSIAQTKKNEIDEKLIQIENNGRVQLVENKEGLLVDD